MLRTLGGPITERAAVHLLPQLLLDTRIDLIYRLAGENAVLGSALIGADLRLLASMVARAPGRDWEPVWRANPTLDSFAVAARETLEQLGPGVDPPVQRIMESYTTYMDVSASVHRSAQGAMDAQAALDARGIPPTQRLEHLMHPVVLQVLREMDPTYHQRAESAVGTQSKRISVDLYDLHELNHVGYTEMMEAVAQLMEEAVALHPGAALLNLGPGPGIDTGYVADRLPNTRIVCLETDPVGFERLLYNMRARPNVIPVLARAEDYGDLRRAAMRLGPDARKLFPAEFAGAWGTFMFHHIQPPVLRPLWEMLHGLILPGGVLVSGEEHIGRNDGTREGIQAALRTYHGGVKREALEKALDPELVRLEQQAEDSGLYAIDPDPEVAKKGCDYKRTVAEDERVMAQAGFSSVTTHPVWTEGHSPMLPDREWPDLPKLEALREQGGIDVMVGRVA